MRQMRCVIRCPDPRNNFSQETLSSQQLSLTNPMESTNSKDNNPPKAEEQQTPAPAPAVDADDEPDEW